MKLNKVLFIVISIIILILGWAVIKNDKQKKVKSLSPQEFDSLSKKPNVFVLDVHVPEQAHIPQTDAFIPYNQIRQNIDKLPKEKTTTILVYCQSGSMSKQAGKDLKDLGFENVYDLTGGIAAYKKSIVKVVLAPQIKNLGKVIYGEIAETDFSLVNLTPNPLNITSISTSCGCTKAKAQKIKLDPYTDTTIKVSFNPATHKDTAVLGNIKRTIYIETDNPDFPQLTADITANVVKK